MADRNKKITFNKPFIVGKELYYIAQAVTVNAHISGNGEFTRQCQQWLEDTLHTRRALLTHSCTAALEMAAILCDIQPGDEVIMPSYTFVSTANAFVLRGGVPVFVDIRSDTLNIDETKIANAITNKTKAIVPVHYAGIPCAMDEILHIADKNNLLVVEDAAQAYLSKQEDNYLGAIGHLGCLSFHETKNIISGEGGALLINDERFLERAEIIWEKGTDRGKFFRGEVDKYSWMDMGSSYQPGELISAFLYAQLEHAEKIIASRSRSFQLYYEGLKDLQDQGLIRLPHLQKGSTGNGHIFFIMTGSADESDRLMQHLNQKQIMAIHHYVPLHSSKAGMRYGRVSGSMTETDEMSQRIVRMPLYYDMEEADVGRVIKEVKIFYGQK
jgi:dTDP-4-amino-4,6-dideoxygalactose transaminase